MAVPEINPVFFSILVALADGETHGYAIMQEVNRLGGAKRVGPTTLYRSIRQLLDLGLIAEVTRGRKRGEEERRRCYRITASGRQAAIAHAERMEQLLGRARSARGLRWRSV